MMNDFDEVQCDELPFEPTAADFAELEVYLEEWLETEKQHLIETPW